MAAVSSALMMGMSSASSAYSQAQAMKTQGEYRRMVAEQNSSLADLQGQEAKDRGDRNAVMAEQTAKNVIGSQRASFAAQGVDANTGSAAEVQSNTAALGALDAMTIRNNAWREAWGYKVQALDYTAQGRMASSAGNFGAKMTLLTGGMNSLSYGTRAAGYAFRGPDTGPSGGNDNSHMWDGYEGGH